MAFIDDLTLERALCSTTPINQEMVKLAAREAIAVVGERNEDNFDAIAFGALDGELTAGASVAKIVQQELEEIEPGIDEYLDKTEELAGEMYRIVDVGEVYAFDKGLHVGLAIGVCTVLKVAKKMRR